MFNFVHTPTLYIAETENRRCNMLNNSRVSFRINLNLWRRFCEVSKMYGINKSDYLRSKIIDFLREKMNNGGTNHDQ